MKKKALVILALILFTSSFSACVDSDDFESKNDNRSFINYTDTGENSSNISGKRTEIENNSSVYKDVVTSNEGENSDTSKKIKSENSSNTSESSNAGSKGSNADSSSSMVNTIIYYYNSSDTDIDSDFTDDSDGVTSQNDVVSSDTDNDLQSENESTVNTDTDVNSNQTSSVNPIDVGSYSEDDIALFVNGEKIFLGDNIERIVEILGEPNSIDNITGPSDPVTVQNIYYYYSDFWLRLTSPAEGSNFRVEAIQLFTDSLETEKGITIGMTLEDVIKTYGGSSTVVNDEYRYYIGNQYMYFDVQNGIVADIGYQIDPSVDN